MAHLSTWNSAYELVPAQADAPSTLGTTGRATRVDIRERMENEHSSYTAKGGTSGGAVAKDFIHKKGSGRAYHSRTAPTVRPDGVTALDSEDDGRLWYDTTYGTLRVWDNTYGGWQPANTPVGMVYQQFPNQAAPASLFGGTWTNVSSAYAGDFFRAEGGAASAFESGEQAATAVPAVNFLGSPSYAASAQAGFANPDGSTTGLAFRSLNSSSGSSTTAGTMYYTRPVNRTIRIWRRTA